MTPCILPFIVVLTVILFSFLVYKAFFCSPSSEDTTTVSRDEYNKMRAEFQHRIHSLERRGLKIIEPSDVRKGMRLWIFENPSNSPWTAIVKRVECGTFYYDHHYGEGSRSMCNVSIWVDENVKIGKAR